MVLCRELNANEKLLLLASPLVPPRRPPPVVGARSSRSIEKDIFRRELDAAEATNRILARQLEVVKKQTILSLNINAALARALGQA